MGRIQSSIGLVTGTDIAGTVDQLMSISARPRDRLLARTSTLRREQQSLAELTASVIGVQLSGNRLSNVSTFRSKSADSSNQDAVSATAGSRAESGSYQVRTLQTASTSTVLSRRSFASDTEALGFTGEISISPSGNLDQSASLSSLNNGRGVDPGKIRIADRSGEAAIIDLTKAQTIDDVLVAINDANISVTATTENGKIKLADESGQTVSNLRVEQLGNDETAADLGLWGIDVAANEATGSEITFEVTSATDLSELRQRSGVRFAEGDDLSISLADGTRFDVDFGDFGGETNPDIQDVLDTINALDPAKVSASFTSSGIEISDLTTGDETFTIADASGSNTASDLGIAGSDDGGTIVAEFEKQVLRGTALDQLAGGSGISGLTTLDITTSDGTTAAIDLSSTSNTAEIVDAINDSGLDIIARLNDAGTGLRLRDVSGGENNFVISSTDDTASLLGIAADTADNIVVGDRLNRQTVSRDTLLSELNRGQGVDQGSFTITDSSGTVSAINLNVDDIDTVGDLIDKINGLGADVTASLGENGDGITIVDNAGGDDTLTISESGNNNTARDLGLLGTASDQTVGGSTESAIIGSQSEIISIEETDSLSDIAEKINRSDRYGTASVQFNDDGSFSLRIRSTQGGADGRIGISTDGFDLNLDPIAEARDAIIAVSTDGGQERILTSSDGVFDLTGTGTGSELVTGSTKLSEFAGGTDSGSIVFTDSSGSSSAINLLVEEITTVGGLVSAINSLGIGIEASVNEEGTGINIIDTAGGDEDLVIADVGNGIAAQRLGIAGTGSTETINGESVTALIGLGEGTDDESGAGLSLTLKELSDSPISINVSQSTSAVTDAASTFVDQYNLLVDKLESLTFFNADTDEVGLLFGSSEAARIRNGYSRLLSGSIAGAGNIKSIGQVGLSFNDQGKLELNATKLREALEDNRSDVEAFFTTDETGLSDRLSTLADRIAGAETGLLLNRTETLGTQITRNDTRIESMDGQLERERERLLLQFYRTEEAISKIQSNSSAIGQIERITIPD